MRQNQQQSQNRLMFLNASRQTDMRPIDRLEHMHNGHANMLTLNLLYLYVLGKPDMLQPFHSICLFCSG